MTWKALKGDPTDNVPGIKGIGDKRAFSLAANVSILEKMLTDDPDKRQTFQSAYDQIILASIDKDSDGWEVKNFKFNEQSLFDVFTQCGFKTIVGKAWTGWKETMERLNDNTSATSPV